MKYFELEVGSRFAFVSKFPADLDYEYIKLEGEMLSVKGSEYTPLNRKYSDKEYQNFEVRKIQTLERL